MIYLKIVKYLILKELNCVVSSGGGY